jgi:hypothetical protein
MQKLLLITILIATIAIPTLAARERSAHKGLKRALFYMFVYELGYLFFFLFIYPRMS